MNGTTPSQRPPCAYSLAYFCLVGAFGLAIASLSMCNFMYVNQVDLLNLTKNELVPSNNQIELVDDQSNTDKFKFGLFRSNFYFETGSNTNCENDGGGSSSASSSSSCVNLVYTGQCKSYRSLDNGFFVDSFAQQLLWEEQEDNNEDYTIFSFQDGPYQPAAFALGLLAIVWSGILVVMFTKSVLCGGDIVDPLSMKMSIVALLIAALMQMATLILFNHDMCKKVECRFGPGSIMAIAASALLALSATLLLSIVRSPNYYDDDDEYDDDDDVEMDVPQQAETSQKKNAHPQSGKSAKQ
mmetsp:Transcript_43570/g.60504  ORF Transcript_43570/g.60504 Transcript_43570/m.60504 type:complete len:298 (+) Transcript_43570:88-981(+)